MVVALFVFWRVWFPVVFPRLLLVQLTYDVIDEREICLRSRPDHVALRLYVFVVVLVVVRAHLAVVVILLWPRHRNVVQRIAQNSFGVAVVFDVLLLLFLFEIIFNFLELFYAVYLLFKRLARIHSFGTVEHEVDDVEVGVVVRRNNRGIEAPGVLSDFRKLVVNLSFVFRPNVKN